MMRNWPTRFRIVVRRLGQPELTPSDELNFPSIQPLATAAHANAGTRAGVVMWSHLLALVCALLLLPAQALAGAKEMVAALAPSGLVLVIDEKGNELVIQNADEPFVPASVTKIVTAWLAMEVLGGDYRFESFYLDNKRLLY